MNLRELLGGLARRWYVVLVGILLSAAACVGVYTSVPLAHSASATVILLPPQIVYGEGGNPFLYLGGLGQAVDVLTRTLNAEEIRGVIEEDNPGVEFEIGADTSSTGPIILIQAKSSDPQAALATMNDVLALVPGALSTIQSDLDVPPNSLITVATVAADGEVETDQKTRLQATLAVGAAGVIGSLLLTALIDARLLTRATRRETSARESTEHASGPLRPRGSTLSPQR